MKKGFSILMIISMMLPNMTTLGILIDFKINQEYIAKVLCINKEKPTTTCNGKCFLTKQLKKTGEQEKKQSPVRNEEERIEIVYYYSNENDHSLITTNGHSQKTKDYYYKNSYRYDFFADVFHPPKFDQT